MTSLPLHHNTLFSESARHARRRLLGWGYSKDDPMISHGRLRQYCAALYAYEHLDELIDDAVGSGVATPLSTPPGAVDPLVLLDPDLGCQRYAYLALRDERYTDRDITIGVAEAYLSKHRQSVMRVVGACCDELVMRSGGRTFYSSHHFIHSYILKLPGQGIVRSADAVLQAQMQASHKCTTFLDFEAEDYFAADPGRTRRQLEWGDMDPEVITLDGRLCHYEQGKITGDEIIFWGRMIFPKVGRVYLCDPVVEIGASLERAQSTA